MIFYIKDILDSRQKKEFPRLEDIFGMDVSHIIRERQQFERPAFQLLEQPGQKENRPGTATGPVKSS
jgi:hypothetical protein